jgi:predicted acyltransferase
MPEQPPSPTPQRLVSLDALRGFDMCMILGLAGDGGVIQRLSQRFFPNTWLGRTIETQFEHVEWEGFHFEDLIFPLFLFLAGVAMTIALPKRLERDGRAKTFLHLAARALIIFLVGVIYSGGLSEGLDKVRWLGVLQRIGVASAVAGALSLVLQTRGLIVATVSLLAGYFLMLKFIPVPGFGAGDFTEGHNLADYIDKLWLPGRAYLGLDHDPEGFLSTLPAIATALLGILAGKGLQCQASPSKKVLEFIVVGAALVSLGWLWEPYFPVIKKIWTSSFVLVAGGWSAILLGVFYGLIEGLNWKRLAIPFVWVGANPIFLYLVHGMGGFRRVTMAITGHPAKDWLWIVAVVEFALVLLAARWLYKQRVFIRI